MNSLFSFSKTSDLRVIIYGKHAESWMTALGPNAQVWQALPEVKEVLLNEAADSSISIKTNSKFKNIIIPLMENHIAKCPLGYFALIPDKKALETFANKANFSDYVLSNGLAALCPIRYSNPATASFPCVLKRTNLNAGQGIEIAVSAKHLQELLLQPSWKDQPYILQAYVPGQQEYVTHCVCKKGKIIWHCTYEYNGIPNLSIRNANLTVPFSKYNLPQSQLAELASFLRPLSYSGPCNLDYKINADGHLIIFEINPRLGGSLMNPEKLDDLKSALASIIKSAHKKNRNSIFHYLKKRSINI